MQEHVAVIPCAEYEEAVVTEAVFQAAAMLGGAASFIRPGMRVLVKPNLLRAAQPEQHITTHPAVVAAVMELVKSLGAEPILAESPGGAYTAATLKTIYKATGMQGMTQRHGFALNYDTGVREVFFEEGKQVKVLHLIEPALSCDAVICVAKLKTHELMGYTGAVKNLFGLVPGVTKAEYHFRLPEQDAFANMLVDIVEYVKPCLSVIDAIWGMEGDGPSAGTPVPIGAILMGQNPHAVDLAAARLVSMEPKSIRTLAAAEERGLVSFAPDAVKLLGREDSAPLSDTFLAPAKQRDSFLEKHVPGFLAPIAARMLKTQPEIVSRNCVGCGICKNSCPAGAIKITAHKAQINYAACLKCYCCHELCPRHAINIHRSLLFRIATKLVH